VPNKFPVHTAGFRFGETGYSRVGTPRHPSSGKTILSESEAAAHERERGLKHGSVYGKQFSDVTPEVARDAMVATKAPRIPWDKFYHEILEWRRGEHFSLIGPTGGGKTTMLFNLYPLHPFTTVFGTKPRDENMDAFVKEGFLRLESWRNLDARDYPRRVIWPQMQKLSDMIPHQRQVFTHAFEAIYREGNWDLIIDEGYYIDEVLKLGAMLRLFYTQARAMNISLVLATQRPAWVPVEVYDQSTHLMFWRDNDERNLKRLRDVSVIHSAAIREIVPNLELHQVLYLNTRTGFMCRTRAPKIDMSTGR
jgi:hypothetical protein